MVQKVYIAPGWTEANQHIKKFAGGFDNNLRLTKNPVEADVIIGHSAGCYMLPPKINPGIIMLINPPYGLSGFLLYSILRNVVFDIPLQTRAWGTGAWLSLRFGNILGLLNLRSNLIKVRRSIQKTDFLTSLKKWPVIVVRNKQDVFCDPEIQELLKKYNNVVYEELPGLHEDCWINPKPYIELLKKNYNSSN